MDKYESATSFNFLKNTYLNIFLLLNTYMGQYYIAIILGNKPEHGEDEVIRICMLPYGYNSGAKLMEHSFMNNDFVTTFEQLIAPSGIFYKSRIVWAGDYADNESNMSQNLYQSSERTMSPPTSDVTYRYIVNHTKKLYVDKQNSESNIHPLPLLVCEGNQRGGGDYWGKNSELCGTWARDVISVTNEQPHGYEELICEFGY